MRPIEEQMKPPKSNAVPKNRRAGAEFEAYAQRELDVGTPSQLLGDCLFNSRGCVDKRNMVQMRNLAMCANAGMLWSSLLTTRTKQEFPTRAGIDDDCELDLYKICKQHRAITIESQNTIVSFLL